MSLTKRGKTWWIIFTAPNGERIRRSSRTTVKREAQELHDKLKSDVWEQDRLGLPTGKTWDDAAIKWLKAREGTANYRKYLFQLKWLQTYLGGKYLVDISRELIETIGEIKVKASSKSNANRFLAVIRAVLRMAGNELKWFSSIPFIKFYTEPKRRIRWLYRHQAARLLKVLPSHQKALVSFALATGLRQGNILGLRWDQLDMQRKVAWIHADQAKSKEAIGVPLNTEAVDVLLSQMGKHSEFVFTFKGNPIKNANTRAWKKALLKCGIENFRWHDLRHTWASWHVQGGTPLHVLQELGGWSSAEMVRRYAHLAPEHLATFADNALLGGNESIDFDTKLTQSG